MDVLPGMGGLMIFGLGLRGLGPCWVQAVGHCQIWNAGMISRKIGWAWPVAPVMTRR